MLGRILVAVALVLILGVPFALTVGKDSGDSVSGDAPSLIIITPHVQQIRTEFAHAFSAWHERNHGTPVRLDYRTPGGTSEIRKQLDAVFMAALKQNRFTLESENGADLVLPPGSVDFDVFFGGGSYDHSIVARGLAYTVPAELSPTGQELDVTVPISVPAGFEQSQLDEWFGENQCGTQNIYDPDQYWMGTALSSFGIVYNTDVLERLDLDVPSGFESLADARYFGWVALADPRQSGSITTTFDSVLGNHGWDEGWRILRAMCGNTRYFTNSSTKPPTDVSQGDAAAGLAIDFYGRGQAQTAGRGRVGYAEPAGAVYIDADPVTIIRGGPNTELARRFVEFCLTEQAQALWQFRALETDAGADNPSDPDSGNPMGPRRYELRRMPVRRVMYERYWPNLVDQVNPFEIASDVVNPGWRTGVQLMMGCFAIDSAEACRAAWGAICRAESDESFPPEVLAEMRRLYFSWPETPIDADGAFETDAPVARVPWTQDTYSQVRNSWRPPGAQARARIFYTAWFVDRYERIAKMRRTRSIGSAPGDES